jgi:hypothetical protein
MPPPAPEHRHAIDQGSLMLQLNTLLRRVANRRSGEPTPREREQILDLRDRIRAVRKGLTDPSSPWADST